MKDMGNKIQISMANGFYLKVTLASIKLINIVVSPFFAML